LIRKTIIELPCSPTAVVDTRIGLFFFLQCSKKAGTHIKILITPNPYALAASDVFFIFIIKG
jgi:hypothetical protein